MNKKFLTKILSIFIGITLGVSLVISGCSVSSKKDSAQVPNGQAVASANKTKNETYQSQPFPEFLQKMIDADGLVNYVNSKK